MEYKLILYSTELTDDEKKEIFNSMPLLIQKIDKKETIETIIQSNFDVTTQIQTIDSFKTDETKILLSDYEMIISLNYRQLTSF